MPAVRVAGAGSAGAEAVALVFDEPSQPTVGLGLGKSVRFAPVVDFDNGV
jgi:hypothetical protein